MIKLALIRHGQSLWNLENRFTGWHDVDLSERGVAEAKRAAKELKQAGFQFDEAHTSMLKRAIRTLWIILDDMDLMWLPVRRAWELNERHYGALQGLNKNETTEKHGAEQVKIWRRSFAIRPPALEPNQPDHPSHDRRYKDLQADQLPAHESLEDTLKRVIPYWEKSIFPRLKAGKQILITAHGNSLRALVKHLDNVSDEAICELNIPTGVPLIYEFDDKYNVREHYYLGDQSEIQAAINEVATQTKKKN